MNKTNHHRGANHPSWKGGRMNCGGYVCLKVDGKYFREHRLVMEKILGRKLYKHEVVHHIDENKTNNSPDNLELMSRSWHCSIHAIEQYPKRIKSKEGKFVT